MLASPRIWFQHYTEERAESKVEILFLSISTFTVPIKAAIYNRPNSCARSAAWVRSRAPILLKILVT